MMIKLWKLPFKYAEINSKTNLIRSISISSAKCCSKENSSDFIPVYKFPYIRTLAVINRIKLYHTCLTVGSVPLALGLNGLGIISFDYAYGIVATGVSGCILLYTLGMLTDKYIGFIYINKNKDEAKISYTNFWGQRKDLIVPLMDIIPFSDMSPSVTDEFFLKFKRFSDKSTLRINMKYGQIVDKDGFNAIFIKNM